MTISTLILTLNEEKDLPNCLKSLYFCDDIVVLDSFSEDRTIDIASSYNARVYQRKFDNYASQRNFGLEEIKYKYDWLLMVDADEIITTELIEEIKKNITEPNNKISLFHVRRKDFFMGKWIKRSSGYPTWFGRVMKLGEVHVLREINEEFYTEGEKGYLTEHLIHYPFSKGIHHWIEKHNKYSSMEATVLTSDDKNNIEYRQFFSDDPVKKRQFLKKLSFKLPFRPVIVFLYLYFFRKGFLDGSAGLSFCILRSMYEYMIDIKIKEITRYQKDIALL